MVPQSDSFDGYRSGTSMIFGVPVSRGNKLGFFIQASFIQGCRLIKEFT